MGLPATVRDRAVTQFAAYRYNWPALVHDCFRTNDGRAVELEPYQADILQQIAHGHDVTVRSGHGVGKTTTDAFAVYCYLLTHPYSLVPTTAPTFRQVKDILWAEIAKWFQHFRLKEHFQLQTTTLSLKGHERTWRAVGVASNRPENIEGFHAPNVLFIVDEAKGVQKSIFDSIDGALTTGGQRLYTSTPGSRIGQFYESHHGRIAKYFHAIHINGEMSARVSQTWREQKAEEWGIDSPIYQAKVLGEFPNEGDDILIRLDYILAAEASFEEEKCSRCGKLESCDCDAPSVPVVPHTGARVLGCDVARFGMDETALADGSASRLEKVETWAKRDLVYTSSRISGKFKDGRAAGIPYVSVGVDDTGLGGGVTDNLAKIFNVPHMPVIFGSTSEIKGSPDRVEHFHNNKAWLCFKYKQALELNAKARERGEVGTYAICNDDKLKGQLSNLRIRYSNKSKFQIIDPDDPTIPIADLPKGVRVSPDRAHAAIICYHTATSSAGLIAGTFTPPAPTPRRDHQRRVSRFIFGR